jgi:transposase
VKNPGQLGVLLSVLKALSGTLELTVAMEPSGTYGDALRQGLSDAGLRLHRISPKAAHDYAEVFDGVPSQHDGKDAAVVAELCALGKGDTWVYQVPEETEQQIAYWVDRMDAYRRLLQVWCGKLEGRMARHWPEAGQLLKVSSATLLRALLEYGGPRELAGDSQAGAKLKRFGGSYLSVEKIQALLHSARATLGVRQTAWEQRRLRDYAQQALAARKAVRQAGRELDRLTRQHRPIRAMATVVGLNSACVLWMCAGDPGGYFCSGAYAKALGLNLTERSSGTWQGKLRISKRGKSMSRRWLYFAALRWVKHPAIQPWYRRKKARDAERARRALVGVMRKLARAVYQVGTHGVLFEPGRLFPGLAAKKFAVAEKGVDATK